MCCLPSRNIISTNCIFWPYINFFGVIQKQQPPSCGVRQVKLVHLQKADIDILFDPSYNIAEVKTMSNKAKKTALSIVREALSTYEIDFLEKVVNGDAAVLDRISILEDLKQRFRAEMEQAEIEFTRLLIEENINTKELQDAKKD